MCRKTVLIVFLVLSFASLGAFHAAALDLKEGQWQIKVLMKIPDMPMQLPPQIQTFCITKDNPAPQKGPIEGCAGCEVIDNRVEGNTVYWVVECDHPNGKVRSEGHVTYSGKTFVGKVKIIQADVVMWQDLSGHWMGLWQQVSFSLSLGFAL
ncbi:MAG TPA: DUF3617 family protein [Deltaproteobacteria bacterium]|nr:DUF3617 family protein [Deltaproteobacteria bacterium]